MSYDNVRFAYPMPNGFEGCDYQSKCMECRLDQYEVTTTGRLVCTPFFYEEEGEGVQPPAAPTDTHFSGTIYIYDYCGTPPKRWQFGLRFVGGQLQTICDTETDITTPYDPILHTQYTLSNSLSDEMIDAGLSAAVAGGLVTAARTPEERAIQWAAMAVVIKEALAAAR